MADQDDSSLLNKSSPIALTCEDFYTKRVRYLERFRERHESLTTPTPTPTSSYRLSKSANSINEYLSNNSASSDISSSAASEWNHGSNFVKLGNDMLYLLEKDVQLTKQLVDLNNAIEQLKTCFASPSATTKNASASSRKLTKVLSNSSLSSVNSFNNVEERTKELNNISKEINHVSVNDDDDIDDIDIVDDYDDDDPFCADNDGQSKKYFQRQNSALRIPVRSRSRRFATEDFTAGSSRTKTKTSSLNGKRNSMPFYEQNRSNLHSPNSDSGHSAASCSSRTPAGNVVAVGSTVLICHGSQSSFDSGVHSASPEEREEIFV
jgi:hypothetical protein